MTKMATIEVTGARRYTRGLAVVLGIMVILAFAMIILAAAPGKEMLNAYGANDSDPISGLTNVYNRDTMQCAFEIMSCDLTP